MSTTQTPTTPPTVQEAIYRLALSLDAFLLNGIQYGVLQRAGGDGFLQQTADNVLKDLASLEGLGTGVAMNEQPNAQERLGALRRTVQRFIDRVMELLSFRIMPRERLRAVLSEIPLLRGQCVQRIQELEACLGVLKPFYSSRPAHSAAAMNEFLSDLEHLF